MRSARRSVRSNNRIERSGRQSCPGGGHNDRWVIRSGRSGFRGVRANADTGGARNRSGVSTSRMLHLNDREQRLTDRTGDLGNRSGRACILIGHSARHIGRAATRIEHSGARSDLSKIREGRARRRNGPSALRTHLAGNPTHHLADQGRCAGFRVDRCPHRGVHVKTRVERAENRYMLCLNQSVR